MFASHGEYELDANTLDEKNKVFTYYFLLHWVSHSICSIVFEN